MSPLTPATIRCIFSARTQSHQRALLPLAHTFFSVYMNRALQTRLKSGPTQSQHAEFVRKPSTLDKSSPQQTRPCVGAGRKIAKSYKDVAKLNKLNPLERDNAQRPTTAGSLAKESGTKRHTIQGKKKILWRGIGTLLAIVGIYSTTAYLDVKLGIPSSDGSHLPERSQLPQTRYLTPTVIREGIIAGWKELDLATVGILIFSLTIQLLKWSHKRIGTVKIGRVVVATSRRSWPAFALNMQAVVWFFPGFVYYFDGDAFHIIAFLTSVSFLTSYLSPLIWRGFPPQLFLLDLSGSVFAALGVYCMVYSTEKVWQPYGLVARLDAREWVLVFVLIELYRLRKGLNHGVAPFHLVNLVSFALGLAYAHYNLKHHLWIPMVSEISSTQASDNEIEA